MHMHPGPLIAETYEPSYARQHVQDRCKILATVIPLLLQSKGIATVIQTQRRALQRPHHVPCAGEGASYCDSFGGDALSALAAGGGDA
jgi:hypothetical protein